MRILRPIRIFDTGHERGLWPVLLLLLVAVVTPTASLLWFLQDVIHSQEAIARQRLMEACRLQAEVLRDRIDQSWTDRMTALETEAASAKGAALFEQCLRKRLADSVVVRNEYPEATGAPRAVRESADWNRAEQQETRGDLLGAAAAYGTLAKDPSPDLAARALQAQARCLLRAGRKMEAARLVAGQFGQPRYRSATDLQGRIIAADAELMAIQVFGPASSSLIERLSGRIADYQNGMPSAQRLFLADELLAVVPDLRPPHIDAERLAARIISAEAKPATPGLQPSPVPGIWMLPCAQNRLLALYREETIAAGMAEHFANLPAYLRGAVYPPGVPVPETAQVARTSTGWQVSLQVESLPGVGWQQTASYVWVTVLAVGVLAVVAALLGGAIRRQVRLARLKTDLVATVSHELKTPVSSIRLLTDTLLETARLDPVRTREYLELIARENNRLAHLIDNFLTFSRMERDRKAFDFLDIDPSAVVQSARDAVRDRFASGELSVEVQADLPRVRADFDSLVTSLINLLDNARKYSREKIQVRLRACAQDGAVAFSVSDEGIGIAARDRDKIFRKFYQVDRRLSRSTGGCGLGLSIVEFIVKAHGGRISVESTPGKGSTFTILLPAAARVRSVPA